MPRDDDFTGAQPAAYDVVARHLHWWTVALIAVQAPLGVAMTIRGDSLGIWDGVTDALYSTHKLLGVVAFAVVAARLGWRVMRGAPAAEGIAAWQRIVGGLTHRAMYALLLAVPVAGWFGVQLYPALDVFGLFALPAVVAPDRAASEAVTQLHALLAYGLLGLIGLHIAAALFHAVIRGDGVLRRMLPPR